MNVPDAAPAHGREATVRALVTGAVIGLVLAAANVYTVIKVGIIDGGAITAALLAFGVFAVLGRSARTPFGALESNITQT
ncbi:MAG TPA: OPT/YSL family transporter, partial [Polyangia bacterium]